jgi:hypothetical protein
MYAEKLYIGLSCYQIIIAINAYIVNGFSFGSKLHIISPFFSGTSIILGLHMVGYCLDEDSKFVVILVALPNELVLPYASLVGG